ncbi:MAG: hypothetical protein V1725_04325 [archaeon]
MRGGGSIGLLTKLIKHRVLAGTMVGVGTLAYYQATGHELHNTFLPAVPSELWAFGRGFISVYAPLFLMRRFRPNELRNMLNSIPLFLKGLTQTKPEQRLTQHQRYGAYVCTSHLAISQANAALRAGYLDESIQYVRKFITHAHKSKLERAVNDLNPVCHAAVLLEKPLQPIMYPERQDDKELIDALTVIHQCLEEDLWGLAERRTKALLKKELSLYYRAHCTELLDALNPAAATASWEDLARRARAAPLEKRVSGDVWEITEKGMRDVLKIRKGNLNELEETRTLSTYLTSIADKETVVMRPLVIIQQEDKAMLVYKHLDGMPLTYAPPEEIMRGARSLATILARAEHPLLHEKHAEHQRMSTASYPLFTLAKRTAFLPEEERTALLEAAIFLAERYPSPSVMKRDSRRDNILAGEKIAQIDIVNDGYAPLADELAKYFYEGSSVDEKTLSDEIFSIFNENVQEKIADKECLLSSIRASSLGRAFSFYGHARDKPYKHGLAKQFLSNAHDALSKVALQLFGSEKELVDDATALLRRYGQE